MAPSPPHYYICPQRGQDSVLLLPHQSRLIAFCLKENLMEYSCFIMLLVSAVQKSEWAICLQIFPFLAVLPIQVLTEHWVELLVLEVAERDSLPSGNQCPLLKLNLLSLLYVRKVLFHPGLGCIILLGNSDATVQGTQACRFLPLIMGHLLSSNPIVHACLVAQLCLTLCDTMDCGLLDSSVRGISQARILEWVATSFSRGSSWPRDWTCLLPYRWILYCLSHQGSSILL